MGDLLTGFQSAKLHAQGMPHGSNMKISASLVTEMCDLIEQQQQRIDELAATVERLRDAYGGLESDADPYGDIFAMLQSTPRQNLNAIKREAVMEFTKYCTDEIERLYGWEGAVIEAESIIKGLTLTAAQRYTDKDGE